MTLIISGLNRVRDLLDTEIDTGEVGTGTTIETRDDTDLVTPVASTEQTLTSSTASKQLSKIYLLKSNLGNSSTITEFSVKNSANDITHSRVTYAGITKTSSYQHQFKIKWFIREGI